jgi:hypothetical protein
MSLVTQLQHPPTTMEPDKLAEIRLLLTWWPGPVELFHVSSHIGVPGNERADLLAGYAAAAATNDCPTAGTTMDMADVRGSVRALTRQCARRGGRGPLDIAGWEPRVFADLPPHLPRRIIHKHLSQLSTGHSPLLGAWLHRVQPTAHPTPGCQRCGAEVDDVKHYVLECPTHEPHRAAAGITGAVTKESLLRFLCSLHEPTPAPT